MQETNEQLNISAAEFFNMLYGGIDEGYITVWHKKTRRTKWFHIKDKERAAEYALARAQDERNVDEIYYGVCLRKERRDESMRGELSDISVVPGLWWDIDVAESENVHAQTALPKSFDEAIGFIKNISQQPSVIVNSGHGLHAYWLFEKSLIISNENELKRCQNLSENWQRYLNSEGAKCGWKGDNTSDLPRILRLPGTVNRKNGGAVEVRVIENSGAKYSIDKFSKYIESSAENKPIIVSHNNGDAGTMDFSA